MTEMFHLESMDDLSLTGSGDTGVSGHRSMGDGRNGNDRMPPSSHLELFGQAKKNINEIFDDLLEFLEKADTFVEGLEKSSLIEWVKCQKPIKDYKESVCGIKKALSRDHMKVVFFGRTSNGKSTTINALLREKVLPTGIGHTTNCFLQIEGSDSDEGYLLTEEEPDKRKNVQSLKQIACALSDEKVKRNSLIRILWPRKKCRLLREDVVLVDSPGIDVSLDFDLWIDKFCLDADVFVLVSNAESTLSRTEKSFFEKVKSKLSKPNLFILQNRWDISALEDDVEKVKEQHLDRSLQFLCDKLKLMDRVEGIERVFFISSRETLASRQEENGTPIPTGVMQKGFEERLCTFSNFERAFEECIFKSAVRTRFKFEQRANKGKKIIKALRTSIEDTFKKSQEKLDKTKQEHMKKEDLFENLQSKLPSMTTKVKNRITGMGIDVEKIVADALNDEIKSLAVLVDQFETPFDADKTSLDNYKRDLHEHLEESIRRKLNGYCSPEIRTKMDGPVHYMNEQLSAFLPQEARQQRDEFEITYRLDCRSLREFQEDISFHFSLGPMNLFPTVKGNIMFGTYLHKISSAISVSPLEEIKMAMTTAGIDVFGVMKFTVDRWRVLAVSVAFLGILYGAKYCYDRLNWTNKAKERAFKSQYVDYASSKLREIVTNASFSCKEEVQDKLTSTFNKLCSQTKSKLRDDVEQGNKMISELEVIKSESETLRKKAKSSDQALDSFKTTFLTVT